MNLDLSVFDTAYDALADDVITKLKKTYPKHNIKRECRKFKLEDPVKVFIDDKCFDFDLMAYLDTTSHQGEDEAFNELKVKIEQFI
jgi:hypothetical protein